jgi:UDP-glucose 4-epimerase
MASRSSGLSVAVTGPTGTFGFGLLPLLELNQRVRRVVGIARRPFDPAEHGWTKLRYEQGDVRNRTALERAFRGADVVVHLAFMITGNAPRDEIRAINVEGTLNAFQAAVAAGAKRFVYASSVAAYGFHKDNPQPLTEDVPALGTSSHYYSAQKAEVEAMLWRVLGDSSTSAYVFRPCIVAGPNAPLLIDNLPYTQLSKRLPSPLRGLLGGVPLLAPVLPDPGVPFQLVHHDDVASAMRAAVLGRGTPGVYNLAGAGRLTVAKLAAELGWHSLPIPRATVDVVAETVSRLGFLPAQVQWISAFREPVIMDTAKARRELRWRPKHTALQTLRETIAATRGTKRPPARRGRARRAPARRARPA